MLHKHMRKSHGLLQQTAKIRKYTSNQVNMKTAPNMTITVIKYI